MEQSHKYDGQDPQNDLSQTNEFQRYVSSGPSQNDQATQNRQSQARIEVYQEQDQSNIMNTDDNQHQEASYNQYCQTGLLSKVSQEDNKVQICQQGEVIVPIYQNIQTPCFTEKRNVNAQVPKIISDSAVPMLRSAFAYFCAQTPSPSYQSFSQLSANGTRLNLAMCMRYFKAYKLFDIYEQQVAVDFFKRISGSDNCLGWPDFLKLHQLLEAKEGAKRVIVGQKSHATQPNSPNAPRPTLLQHLLFYHPIPYQPPQSKKRVHTHTGKFQDDIEKYIDQKKLGRAAEVILIKQACQQPKAEAVSYLHSVSAGRQTPLFIKNILTDNKDSIDSALRQNASCSKIKRQSPKPKSPIRFNVDTALRNRAKTLPHQPQTYTNGANGPVTLKKASQLRLLLAPQAKKALRLSVNKSLTKKHAINLVMKQNQQQIKLKLEPNSNPERRLGTDSIKDSMYKELSLPRLSCKTLKKQSIISSLKSINKGLLDQEVKRMGLALGVEPITFKQLPTKMRFKTLIDQ